MKHLNAPMSGSQANTTASKNRFGQYFRSRAIPTNPNTPAQQTARNNFTAASKAWAGLTDAQRLAWKNFADSHPRVNSLGTSTNLTGAQMYNAVNSLNLTAGIAQQPEPPDGSVIAPPDFSLTDATHAALSGKVHTAIPVANTILIWSSPPASAGRAFNGDSRLVKILVGTNAADQIVLTAAQLTTKFGTLVAGQKYFFSVQVLHAGNLSAFTSLAVVLG